METKEEKRNKWAVDNGYLDYTDFIENCILSLFVSGVIYYKK